MIADIIEIPNVFKNPEHVFELAKQQTYYRIENNPVDKNTDINYVGSRTLPIHNNDLAEELFSKLLSETVRHKTHINGDYIIKTKFHSLTKEDIFVRDNKWLHQDNSIMAGVVYLNDVELENPKDHGTLIIKNGVEINIPYVYNTLVMYRSDYTHAAQSGFGDCIANSRLTFNFFFDAIKLELHI